MLVPLLEDKFHEARDDISLNCCTPSAFYLPALYQALQSTMDRPLDGWIGGWN